MKNQKETKCISTYIAEGNAMILKSHAADIVHDTVSETSQNHALYYGSDMRTLCPIILNRFEFAPPHGIMIGFPGSGKHYAAMMEIAQIYMPYPNSQIVILDTQHKYADLCRKLNGTIITSNDAHTRDDLNSKNRFVVYDLANRFDTNGSECITQIKNIMAKHANRKNHVWIYITVTDVHLLKHKDIIRDICKIMENGHAVFTFLSESWQEIPEEITESCQYVQLFTLGIHNEIDREFQQALQIPNSIVSCMDEYARTERYLQTIRGLLVLKQNGSGTALYTPFVYRKTRC